MQVIETSSNDEILKIDQAVMVEHLHEEHLRKLTSESFKYLQKRNTWTKLFSPVREDSLKHIAVIREGIEMLKDTEKLSAIARYVQSVLHGLPTKTNGESSLEDKLEKAELESKAQKPECLPLNKEPTQIEQPDKENLVEMYPSIHENKERLKSLRVFAPNNKPPYGDEKGEKPQETPNIDRNILVEESNVWENLVEDSQKRIGEIGQQKKVVGDGLDVSRDVEETKVARCDSDGDVSFTNDTLEIKGEKEKICDDVEELMTEDSNKELKMNVISTKRKLVKSRENTCVIS